MTSEPGRHSWPDRHPVLDDLSKEARSGALLGYMSLLGVTAAVVFAAVGALVGIAFNDVRRSGGNGWWGWR